MLKFGERTGAYSVRHWPEHHRYLFCYSVEHAVRADTHVAYLIKETAAPDDMLRHEADLRDWFADAGFSLKI